MTCGICIAGQEVHHRPLGRPLGWASIGRPLTSVGKATSERATEQNLNVIGAGKEPMLQNMIGNLSRPRFQHIADIA